MTEMLYTQGFSRRFGGIQAVQDCNISVQSGSITGLIGPNGSGKTTLFNLITGVYPPDEGEAFFNGKRITNLAPNKICREGLSRTFQITRLFWEMTVLENMIVPIRQVGFRALLGPNMFLEEVERATATPGTGWAYSSEGRACPETVLWPAEAAWNSPPS